MKAHIILPWFDTFCPPTIFWRKYKVCCGVLRMEDRVEISDTVCAQ